MAVGKQAEVANTHKTSRQNMTCAGPARIREGALPWAAEESQPAVCDLCVSQPASNTQETAAPNGVGFCDAPLRPRGGPRNGAINPHNPAQSIEFVHFL